MLCDGATNKRHCSQIHDEVFPRLASGQLPENSNALPRLLGVTNLYFLKALPSWPNVLSTGKRTVLQRSVSDGGLQVKQAEASPAAVGLAFNLPSKGKDGKEGRKHCD